MRDELWSDEDVEAHTHQLLGRQELVGRVSREDLLKLHPPLLAVAGGGGDNVGGGQSNQLFKTDCVDIWRLLKVLWLQCVCMCERERESLELVRTCKMPMECVIRSILSCLTIQEINNSNNE